MSTSVTSTAAGANDTLAHFVSWAQPISNAFAAFGWVQSNDTGQVVWTATVLTFSGVVLGGTTITATYSGYTGPAPRVGMSVIVTGFAAGSGQNNGTFTLTAVSGGASGTVQWTNASGVTESHSGSGTTTALAAGTYPSAINTTVYECWQMGDTGTFPSQPFFLKVEYGTGATINYPAVWVTLSTSNTTAGAFPANTLTSNTGTRTQVGTSPAASASMYEEDFSGGLAWFGCFLFRNSTGNLSRGFCVERSKTTAGGDTGNYATLISTGTAGAHGSQQTVFSASVNQLGNGITIQENKTTGGSWCTVLPLSATTGTVNGSTLVSPVFPLVGFIDIPHLMAMVFLTADYAEGTIFTGSFLGGNHTYLASSSTGIGPVGNSDQGGSGTGFPAIRWE